MGGNSGADMISFGLYSNGVYGRLDASNGLDIEAVVVEAVTQTGMSLKKGLGSAGLYNLKLRGRAESIRFLSSNFEVGADDIAFVIGHRLVAVHHGDRAYVFGEVLASIIRRSFWGRLAWVLGLVGAPWFQAMLSNALYQLLTMMPDPLGDTDQVQGCHYMTSFDLWEPVANQTDRINSGRV